MTRRRRQPQLMTEGIWFGIQNRKYIVHSCWSSNLHFQSIYSSYNHCPSLPWPGRWDLTWPGVLNALCMTQLAAHVPWSWGQETRRPRDTAHLGPRPKNNRSISFPIPFQPGEMRLIQGRKEHLTLRQDNLSARHHAFSLSSSSRFGLHHPHSCPDDESQGKANKSVNKPRKFGDRVNKLSIEVPTLHLPILLLSITRFAQFTSTHIRIRELPRPPRFWIPMDIF
jgi:hypothetical protein